MKGTARRRVDGARDIPSCRNDRLFSARVGHGDGRDENLRVGVQRPVVEIAACGKLHDLPQVHDGHAVTHVLDDTEVVGDEQVGQLEFLLEAPQQVQDLGLDRDIQGRDRLIRDDEPRRERERARQADPLPLGQPVVKSFRCHSLFPPYVFIQDAVGNVVHAASKFSE